MVPYPGKRDDACRETVEQMELGGHTSGVHACTLRVAPQPIRESQEYSILIVWEGC